KRQLAPSEARMLKNSTYGGALRGVFHQPDLKIARRQAPAERTLAQRVARSELSSRTGGVFAMTNCSGTAIAARTPATPSPNSPCGPPPVRPKCTPPAQILAAQPPP